MALLAICTKQPLVRAFLNMNFLCNRGGGGIILFATCCYVLSVSDKVLSNEKLMEKSLDVSR